jgi:hypothetical protein
MERGNIDYNESSEDYFLNEGFSKKEIKCMKKLAKSNTPGVEIRYYSKHYKVIWESN